MARAPSSCCSTWSRKLQVTLRELQAENQRLRDENNRLKGEQGQPNFKANQPPQPPAASDHSSEAERRQPQAWRKGPKLDRITITREAFLPVDPASLPADAAFKGHEDVVVQDVRFETDNILFHKAKYSSRPLCILRDGRFFVWQIIQDQYLRRAPRPAF